MTVKYYSSTTTLEVTGGTEGTPLTFEHIWDWDDNGSRVDGNGEVEDQDNLGTYVAIDTLLAKPASGMWVISCDVDFGDGTTSTYFASKNELVEYDQTVWNLYANATLQLGESQGDGGKNGSVWKWDNDYGDDYHRIKEDDGILLAYASSLLSETDGIGFFYGDKTCVDCKFSLDGPSWFFGADSSSLSSLTRPKFINSHPKFYKNPAVFVDPVVIGGSYGAAFGYADGRVEGLNVVYRTIADVAVVNGSGDYNIEVVNPKHTINGVYITTGSGTTVNEIYTAQPKITYNNSAVENATVSIEQAASTDGGSTWGSWSELSSHTTAADGTITEQELTAKKWVGNETVGYTITDYKYRFVISHADYPTLTTSEFQLDGPLDWEIEMPISTTDLRNAIISDGDGTEINAANLNALTGVTNIDSLVVGADGRVDVSKIEGSDATDQIAGALLDTPANKLATDASGRVDLSKINGNLASNYLEEYIHLSTTLGSTADVGDEYIVILDAYAEVDEGDVVVIQGDSQQGTYPAPYTIATVRGKLSSGGYRLYIDPNVQYSGAVGNDVTVYSAKATSLTDAVTLDGASPNNFNPAIDTVSLTSATETQIDNIETDTNEIQGDLSDGGRLDLLIDAIKAKTDSLKDSWNDPDAESIASAVWSATTRTLTGFGSLISNIWSATTRTLTAGTKDSEIDDILADTSEIQVKLPTGDIADESNVETHVTNSLNNYDPPTKAELDSAIAGLNDPTVEAIKDAILNATGITAGGTYTFSKLIKGLYAFNCGKWIDKTGVNGTYQILDPEDNETVILEVTPSESSPYKQVSIQ